ncbi:MAG: hypothetical protein N3F64_03920 [Nitrososphaeria archaeon]|nr:hypothetical protein [Nitrososphaeria archaeon]
MFDLKRFVGMFSAIILSTPLNIATLIFSQDLFLGIVTVISSFAAIALCGIFYDIILSKIKNSISSYGKFLAYTGFFWIMIFPFQQYFIELIICYILNQPITSFTIQYLVFGMIFGLGFALLFSIVYIRLFAYIVTKDADAKEPKALKSKKRV